MITLIKTYNLPYKYVGDGSTIIGGKVPDFINNNGEKKLIEIFGDYWHDPKDIEIRRHHFAKYGFRTLIIWEHEIKSLSEEEIISKIEWF